MPQPGKPPAQSGEVIPFQPPQARWRLHNVTPDRRAGFRAGMELALRLSVNPRPIVEELEPLEPAEDHGTGRRVLIVIAFAALAWLILRVSG